MASIATEARPAIAGALLFALAVWLECQPCRGVPRAAFLATPPVTTSWIAPAPPLSWFADVVEPGEHPDAREWPLGMVIRPAPSLDNMRIGVAAGPLDILLSALLGPWLAPTS